MTAPILYTGTVLSLSEENAWIASEAMIVEGERIAFVGSLAAARARVPEANAVSLEGTAIPGFVDPHHHVGVSLVRESAMPLSGLTSADAMGAALAEVAARTPKGEWIVAYDYNEAHLPKRKHISLRELDQYCPDHPLCVFHYTFHQGLGNSRALDLVGIGRETPNPVGGEIVRDAKGNATGVLIETAFMPLEGGSRASVLARDGHAFPARLHAYEDRLFASGITCIGDAAVSPDIEALYQSLHAEKRLRVPIVMLPVEQAGIMLQPSDRLAGTVTGEGDEHLRVGPLKLWMDGADACALCLPISMLAGATLRTMLRAFKTRSTTPFAAMGRGNPRMGQDGNVHLGTLFYRTRDAARAQARRIAERGFSLAVHAIGNEGVEWALDMCEAAREVRQDIPFRIEHAILLDDHALERLGRLRPTVVTQACFIPMFADDPTIPSVPGLHMFALAQMKERGVPLALSSDAPVTVHEPLYGIRAAVKRTSPRTGVVYAPEAAISVADAFAMYTRHAARSLGVESFRGSLEAGKFADFVVLNKDPRTTDVNDLAVEATYLRGEKVYARQG